MNNSINRSRVIFSGFDRFYLQNTSSTVISALKSPDFNQFPLQEHQVVVTKEVAISVNVNGTYWIHLQISPLQLEPFIVGYLVCEGILPTIDALHRVEFRDPDQIWVWINVNDRDLVRCTEIRTSGCVGIKQQGSGTWNVIQSDMRISPTTIFAAQDCLVAKTHLWRETGGTHMAGLFDTNGNLLYYAEDCGRHNTIDKIVGQALMNGCDLGHTFAVLSGRLSAAMMIKLARAGIPIVVSKAAPLLNGIDIGKRAGITMVGFARSPAFNIYTHPERILHV